MSRPAINVLFIGNSLTYFNNLGDIVAGVAASNPEGPIIVPTLAATGGQTLKGHLSSETTSKLVEGGGWDYVVLQEHSLLGGSFVDGKAVLNDPAEFFCSVREWVQRIETVAARPILYMTSVHRDAGADVQNALADAYLTIGRELNVRVAPAGLAWAEARRRLCTLDLHFWDGWHPTEAGSYLSALVIYSTVTGRNPVGAPVVIYGRPAFDDGQNIVLDSSLRVPLVDLRDATARELQEVAKAIAFYRDSERLTNLGEF